MPTLTEEDIKNRHITPAIEQVEWTKEQTFMEYYFTGFWCKKHKLYIFPRRVVLCHKTHHF
jgi:hypothetical protein